MPAGIVKAPAALHTMWVEEKKKKRGRSRTDRKGTRRIGWKERVIWERKREEEIPELTQA